MDFVEYQGKRLLHEAGLVVPRSIHCDSADDAAAACGELGACVVKAQVPIGKRGKAGGIAAVSTANQAKEVAERILGMTIGGHVVNSVLVEEQAEIEREFYAAVMTDLEARAPLILFSAEGGMEIEELAEEKPDAICRIPVDIERGIEHGELVKALSERGVDDDVEAIAHWLATLYDIYIERDAELVEINPLVMKADGNLAALDCKLSIDDSAGYRQEDWAAKASDEPRTELESRGASLGFKYFELDGEVGLLANGAGLTMTTMDVISHAGGQPANFLEIGGEAYTKATPALELVLANPRVKSLVVNFCGAFARTDVMTEGVIDAWETLKPDVPVFFSIHGTGEDEAVAMLTERLSITPYERMEDAVAAAVEAAR